jgi:hypothetical protein
MIREFTATMSLARVNVTSSALSRRIDRTGHFDKNMMTELRALERDEDVRAVQAERGRLLQFPTRAQAHARRHASGGREPDGAA